MIERRAGDRPRRGRTVVFLSALGVVVPVVVLAVVPAVIMAVASPVAFSAATGPRAEAGATFTVDTTADDADVAPGDGVCATAAGRCSLRAAITEANRRPGHDTIAFAIAGARPHRIRPTSALPQITDPAGVTIDGYSQSGARPNRRATGSDAVIAIELIGRGPAGIDGLDIRSSDNVVQGLAIHGFRRAIRLFGVDATDNRIVGNFIGTDPTASVKASVRFVPANGINLERGASRNAIGAPGDANRNVISGLADRGVAMFDIGTESNLVQNNVIGLRPDGSAALPNRGHGVDVNTGASNNLIGGNGPGERNVISGNVLAGVEISHNPATPGRTTSGNRVVGNLIGTDATGSIAPMGLRNRQFGINFEGAATCVDECPTDIVDNSAFGNVIVGSEANVIISKGASRNTVEANTIGLLADGTRPASASATIWGVLIEAGANDNRVAENTIAATAHGVQVLPGNSYACVAADPRCPGWDSRFATFGNVISRNRIFAVSPGLAIDLSPAGAAGAGEALVQGGIALPVIAEATPAGVRVTTCAGCTVEVFVADPSAQSDHGQARRFVNAAVADAEGVAVVLLRTSPGGPLLVGACELLSVTSTHPTGGTSELSRRVAITGWAPPSVCRPARGALQPAERLGPPIRWRP